jgi:hypothetical protein
MLTIEDYIASRKKKDKLDEFDFQKHSENMGTVIKYVMEYFNQYLNLEDYSYEQVKMQQAVDKFKAGIMERYPTMYEFIISYYWENKKRIDNFVDKAYREMDDSELFYSQEDYRKVAEYVCNKKLNLVASEELLNNVAMMAKDHKQVQTEGPSISDMKELDNAISDWVQEVFRIYRVDLVEYARNISYEFFEKYVDREYDREFETFYYINKYDYRYQENPFNINAIYEKNMHREFINGHKGELEMLIMYYWLFEDAKDPDYWPEYVNLCISNGRVNLAKHKRILKPICIDGIDYPCDIDSNIKYVETINGIINKDPGLDYVACILYNKMNDTVWKDKDSLDCMIKNLQTSFKKYGAPKLLEFLSPYRTPSYDEEAFFEKYQIFEKSMRRYTKMKIAIINGYTKKNKGKDYLFATVDDIVRLRNACKEMKLQLKLSVDFTDYRGKNIIKNNIDDMVNTLASMRNFIVGLHMNAIDSWGRYKDIYVNDERHEYISTMDYPTLSTFMAGLSTILQDSRPRYFIPNTVRNSETLEILIDTLYRGGCCFESEVIAYEK